MKIPVDSHQEPAYATQAPWAIQDSGLEGSDFRHHVQESGVLQRPLHPCRRAVLPSSLGSSSSEAELGNHHLSVQLVVLPGAYVVSGPRAASW